MSETKRPTKEKLYQDLSELGGSEGVAVKYGVHKRTVDAWRRHYGEHRQARPLQRPPKREMVDMQAMFGDVECASRYNVNYTTWLKWKKYYRMPESFTKDTHWNCKIPQRVIEAYRLRLKLGEAKHRLVQEMQAHFGLHDTTCYSYLNYQERV